MRDCKRCHRRACRYSSRPRRMSQRCSRRLQCMSSDRRWSCRRRGRRHRQPPEPHQWPAGSPPSNTKRRTDRRHDTLRRQHHIRSCFGRRSPYRCRSPLRYNTRWGSWRQRRRRHSAPGWRSRRSCRIVARRPCTTDRSPHRHRTDWCSGSWRQCTGYRRWSNSPNRSRGRTHKPPRSTSAPRRRPHRWRRIHRSRLRYSDPSCLSHS